MDKKMLSELEDKSKIVRKTIIEILAEAGGGHYGGSLSCVEILVGLYFHSLRINSEKPDWKSRDRFILSKGHACACFVSVLAERGFFSKGLLNTFNKLDSPFGMHPDMHKIKGCDMSTGSLGHGLSVGIGMALASKLDNNDYRVFVLAGDGECQEGTIWEGAMTAAHYELDNLVLIVDRNNLSMDGATESIMALGNLGQKFEAFGWSVKDIDGHDLKAITKTFDSIPFNRKMPSAIIANTIKGKGVSCMENICEWHYNKASDDLTQTILKEYV